MGQNSKEWTAKNLVWANLHGSHGPHRSIKVDRKSGISLRLLFFSFRLSLPYFIPPTFLSLFLFASVGVLRLLEVDLCCAVIISFPFLAFVYIFYFFQGPRLVSGHWLIVLVLDAFLVVCAPSIFSTTENNHYRKGVERLDFTVVVSCCAKTHSDHRIHSQ